jgi:hypothetical protein
MSVVSPIDKLVARLSPKFVIDLGSVLELEGIKHVKDTHICTGKCKACNTSLFFCSKCKGLNKKLCRRYHDLEPLEELVSRLVYEYMFGMISAADIAQGRWMERCRRDYGHHERIVRLVSRIDPAKLTKCRWLVV